MSHQVGFFGEGVLCFVDDMDDFLQKSKNRNGESIYWEYVSRFWLFLDRNSVILQQFPGRSIENCGNAKIYDVKHFLASEVAIMSIYNHHRGAGNQH